MRTREIIIVFILLVFIAFIFFYKVFLGLVPFPGDLLAGEYKPWQAYSYLGYNPGAIPNKAQYFDVIRQIYPWKTLAIDVIKNGELPFWNPYNFSGSPLFANIQSAILYPLSLLYFVFPQVWSWSILVVLQTLLAGFFTYLFAREIGINRIGRIFSSIVFSYSLYMSVFLEYNTIGQTILWLPLSLFLLEKLSKKITFTRAVFFAASLVFSFFAGHIQIFAFSLLFIAIYAIFRLKRKAWLPLLLMLLSIGISAVQLLPTIELINNSARTIQSYGFLVEKLLLQPYQMILFLSPDIFGNPATRNYLINDTYPGNAIYIGLVPFIFALFAITSFKKNYFTRFFTVSSIALLLLFIRSPITEMFYSLQIPLLSTGSPTNAIFLLSFSFSILSGFGISHWLEKTKRFYVLMVITISVLFILIWLFSLFFHPTISIRNFVYSTLLLIVFLLIFLATTFLKKYRQITGIVFIVISLVDLFYFFHKFNPFVPKELVFPKASILTYLQDNIGINRFWGYGTAAIEANFATQYKLFSPDGYDPLYLRRYGEFIQSAKDGKIKTEFTTQTRSDAIITPGFGQEDLSLNTYRLKVADLLGVKYILDRVENGSTEKTFPGDRFKLIYNQDDWRIFENLVSLPRAFLVSDYRVFKTKEEFENIFFSKEFNPIRTVLLEEDIGSLDQNKSEKVISELRIISYNPNQIVINTRDQKEQLLFLSDAYYPGWKAYVDRVEKKIYRANYAFRAVLIPAGIHTVIFSYQPQSFFLGIKMTIISLIVLLTSAFILAKKNYEK